MRCASLLVLVLTLTSSCVSDGEKDEPATRLLGEHLERGWKDRPEWGEMAVAILKREALGPGKGWWKPPGNLYGFDWLLERCDLSGDGLIQKGEWTGAGPDFERLDRDEDGEVSPADFDWSRESPRHSAAAFLFQHLDRDSNGRITHEELRRFFEEADRGSLGFVSREDLESALAEDPPERGSGPRGRSEPPASMLLSMLFAGQLGSLNEGPRPGTPAPEIHLKTQDGESSYRLSDSRGRRPVVLIFGSFT